jgi:hypothetical protein
MIRWLTFQRYFCRRHDESLSSVNRGNFLEMLKFLALYGEVSEVAPQNTPKNEKYILPDVRKNILSIYARKVQKSIREELKIASYFCSLPLYLNRGSTPA